MALLLAAETLTDAAAEAELFRRFGGVFCELVFDDVGLEPKSLARRPGLFVEIGDIGRLMVEGEVPEIVLRLLLGFWLFLLIPLGDVGRLRIAGEGDDEEEETASKTLSKVLRVSAGDVDRLDLCLFVAVVGIIDDFSDSHVVFVDLSKGTVINSRAFGEVDVIGLIG